MLKASDVIELAKNDPRYPYVEGWLCSIIYELEKEAAISQDQGSSARDAIDQSLGQYSFLRSKFLDEGVIAPEVGYNSPQYRKVAIPFWDKLIAKLRAEGK